MSYFKSPVLGTVNIQKNDKFGERILKGKKNNHKGVDLRPSFDHIFASHSGQVIFSGKDQFGGLYIDIKDGRFMTRYLHNSINLVKVGDKVNQGQLIGKIGNTGNSTGRHLHFEVWVDGVRRNPEEYVNFSGNLENLDKFEYYTVKSGDTLGLIAERLLGDFRKYKDLVFLNKLEDANFIKIGQKLKIKKL